MNFEREVIEIKNPSSLRIRLHCGTDDNGDAITKSKTYSSVKYDALGGDVYSVADGIVSLQKHTVLDILKQDYTSLN